MHTLQSLMDDSASAVKQDKAGSKTSTTLPIGPASRVLSGDLSRYEWPLLKYIIHTPILLHNGRVLDEPGYDAESQLYLSLPDGFQVLPRPKPSRSAAMTAYAEIGGLLNTFPFASASGLANSMAFIFGIVAKDIIDSTFPMLLITGSTKGGAGKTLLSRAIVAIGTGVDVPMSTLPDSNDRVRKFLLSHFRESPVATIIDNVKSIKPIKLPLLNSALTGGQTSDRVLQRSNNITFDLRGHPILMNGNGLTLGCELMRRTLAVTFSASMSDPTKRRPESGYKHDGDELVQFCLSQRSEINAKLLTILESWAGERNKSGLPGEGQTRVLASYEEWSRVVGSILYFCGQGDAFLRDRDEVIAGHSDEGQEDFAFVDAMFHTIGSAPFRAGDLLERINENKLLTDLIPSSLSKKCSGAGSKASAFGHWLKERRGATFGVDNAIQIQRRDALSPNGTAIWQFVRVDPTV